MRAIWSGAISFGLVNIPVRLYTAVEERELKFNLFHKPDFGSIRYARVCKRDGKEVPFEQIVKAYEYQKGNYVIVEDEDFEKANVRKTKTIEISEFAHISDVDPKLYEKPYYLEPEAGAEKPYALLREALKKSKKVAVATFVLRNRERLALLEADNDTIILYQLRFQSEVRPADELKLPKKEALPTAQLEIAMKLVSEMTGKFVPGKHKDVYTKEIMEVIARKAKGQMIEIKGEEPQPTKVPDLMETLMESLKHAEREEKTVKK